jgi:hypothetical protein
MKETEVIKTLLDDESLDSIKVSIIKAIAKHIVKRYDGRVTRVLNERTGLIDEYHKAPIPYNELLDLVMWIDSTYDCFTNVEKNNSIIINKYLKSKGGGGCDP